ncbi:MAG: hypothetical protein AMXMBFR8_01260 [Nevskiales bacterium]
MTQSDSGHCPGVRPDEKAMRSVERIERTADGAILYDGTIVNHMKADWFDPAHWPAARVASGDSGGRGATLFIRCEGQDWVLRHYHRGGAVARFARDGYPWLGEDRTRSFAEWRLLGRIRNAGLPAPRPVAARYRRRGMVYRADLITVLIPGVVPLSTYLARRAVDEAVWRNVGACIARFHRAGFFHADLNAHNLQINERGEIFLLDFDRGRERPAAGAWQQRNLARLRRSLMKISADGAVRFTGENWSALLAGHGAELSAARS